MKISAWLIGANNRRAISYLSYSAAAVVVIFSLIWAVQIALTNADAALTRATIKSKQAELVSSRSKIQVTPVQNSQFDVPVGVAALEQFRALSVAVAHANGVTLQQFSTTGGVTAFGTHYGGSFDVKGYSAIHVQLMLNGSLPYVMQMLRTLAESRMPFEFGSLELTPQTVTENGKEVSRTITKVELDLLTKGGAV